MFAYGEEYANYQEWRQQPMPKEYKYESFQNGLAFFPYLFIAFFATCVVWALISALTLAAWWLTKRFFLPFQHQPSLPGERRDFGGRQAVGDNPYRPPRLMASH
jgi:hypothetical protein